MIKRLLLTVLLSIASVNVAAQSEGPEPPPHTPNPTVPPNISLTYNAAVSRLVAPGYVMLVANAEAFDSTIASISIHNGSVLLGTVKAGTNTFLWKDVPAGTHALTAVATDSRGIWSRSAPLSVTVTGNASPTVTLTATLTGASAPGTVVLSAAASDSDGTVSKVEFFNGSTLLATVAQAPFVYTWSNVPVGSYNLFARATDNLGAATTSQPSLVTVTAAGAQVYYLYADQVNTAREITNAAGVVVWRADITEPFGVNMPNENPSNQGTFTYNPRFPGQSFDKESGLHYNYFRDYDPTMGRYIQSDPIGLRGGFNTYSYVDNSPIGFIDPLGESKVTGQASIGGSDSAIAGVTPKSTKAEIDAAIKRAEEIIRDPKASPARKNYLKGWVKVAKRGFTRMICPPFLEDIAMAVARQQCLAGDLQSCAVFHYLGGEIVNPNEI